MLHPLPPPKTNVLNLQAGTLRTLQNSLQSTCSLFALIRKLTAFTQFALLSPFPNNSSLIPCPAFTVFSTLSDCLFSSSLLLCSLILSSPYLRTVEHCLLFMRSGRLVGFTTHFCFLTSGRCLPDAHIQPAPEFQDLPCSDTIFDLSKSLIKQD